MVNLSADIYCDVSGKKWSTVIRDHPPEGGDGKNVFEKHGMKTAYHAETAMEAAWRRLSGAD